MLVLMLDDDVSDDNDGNDNENYDVERDDSDIIGVVVAEVAVV